MNWTNLKAKKLDVKVCVISKSVDKWVRNFRGNFSLSITLLFDVLELPLLVGVVRYASFGYLPNLPHMNPLGAR